MLIRFHSPQDRDSFLDLLDRERADIKSASQPSKTLPVVILATLTAEQRNWISQHVQDSAVFEDIAFGTMLPSD